MIFEEGGADNLRMSFYQVCEHFPFVPHQKPIFDQLRGLGMGGMHLFQ